MTMKFQIKPEEKEFFLLSPDGFSIDGESSFKSLEAAEAAFEKWKQRYASQGYYSANTGRIPLNALKAQMTLAGVPYLRNEAFKSL